MTSHRYRPGDRVSWLFDGQREYGIVDHLSCPHPEGGGPSYQVRLDFDPTGFALIHESALRLESVQ